MDGILHYLFSFSGRINRTKWWLAQGIMGAMAMVWMTIATNQLMQQDGFTNFNGTFGTIRSEGYVGHQSASGYEKIDPPAQAPKAEDAENPMRNIWISFLILAWPFCWIWLAVTAKRLHDIGKSGWWGLPAFLPTMLHGTVLALSNGYDNMEVVLWLSPFIFSAQVVQGVAGLWLMSMCGFSKGFSRANEYGPPDSVVARMTDDEPKARGFEREDVLIRAAVARMSAPVVVPTEIVHATSNTMQRPSFGKR